MCFMSVQPVAGAVPEWTMSDRLRKAREHAGFTQSELAGITGISRASIQNYEAAKTKPSRPVLLSWAMACGISHKWLCHGDHQPCPDGSGEPASAGQRKVITGRYLTRPVFANTSAHFLPAAA